MNQDEWAKKRKLLLQTTCGENCCCKQEDAITTELGTEDTE
jgi:hypothetical protein